MIHEETDFSQLSDVAYICSCVCCDELKFDEGKGIDTSDGWAVCSIECLKVWEGDNFINHPAAKENDKCIFCNGKGKIMHFHHVENGKCFRCNGTGKKTKIKGE